MTELLVNRFWDKVDKQGADDCWPWVAARNSSGYGSFVLCDNVKVQAHRLAYELAIGPIPKGMLVCHTCDVPLCCNPRHLFIGTAKDNTQDMISKGRAKFSGGAPKRRKFTDQQIRVIRVEYESPRITLERLAKKYGVARSTICRIVNRECYRDVD